MKRAFVSALFPLLLALGARTAAAQDPATVTGRVTNEQGQPEAAVLVRIESLNVGASTAADGMYRLLIPGARIRAGQNVAITASRAGLAPVTRNITLSPGATVTQNFQMTFAAIVLEDVVVTGVAGRTARASVPFEIATVTAEHQPVPSATGPGGAIQAKVAGAAPPASPAHPGAGGFNTEEYNPIQENPFLAVAHNPLSTFSIDVDPASYSNVRRFIRDRQLPPRDAVRIEEMVNYFRYADPDPAGPHP
ncbi:MAG TPA: von Willebrand factor type A domain-containing protein, partial [Longimicrobium sp.]|nr:von Willebrand factor type A domain-containing protein [Longimicrobium sp.]